MSKQYQRLINLLEASKLNTDDLTKTTRGKMRADLIGDNDLE